MIKELDTRARMVATATPNQITVVFNDVPFNQNTALILTFKDAVLLRQELDRATLASEKMFIENAK